MKDKFTKRYKQFILSTSLFLDFDRISIYGLTHRNYQKVKFIILKIFKTDSCMVDRILELSTTYSMIPGKAKQKKQLADIYE